MAEPNEEMRELADAADLIDDATFDPDVMPKFTAEELGVTDPPPETEEKPSQEPVEPPEEEAPAITLDSLLGVDKPAEEPQEESAGEEQPEAKEPESGAQARIRELSEAKAASDKRYDELVALQMKQAGPQPTAEETQEPIAELEPEVAEYMRPYFAEANKKLLDRIDSLEKSVQPMQAQVQDELYANEIAKHVPGFKPDMLDKLKAEFDAMPESEQPIYRDGGIAGAVILAQKMASRGALAVGTPKKNNKPSELASRHNSDMGSDTTVADGGTMSDEDKLKLINDASEEDVLRMLAQLEAQ